MARWEPAKKDVLEELAVEILHNYGHGRTIVAVDGSAQFADDLATALGLQGSKVFRATMNDFHRSQAAQAAGGLGTYEGSYDYSLFQRVLVDPFRAGGSTGFVLAGFDAKRDMPIQAKWTTAGTDAILIVDGEYLNRPELAGFWNYSIWIDDLSPADETYLREVEPRGKATAIIDNRNPDHPKRQFADSC